ncbi:hypothetical protein KXR53_05905 [Inquilinus limosus]|uniref:hypothetical protein n=1 Tax=Inquilinus limosus TaxID=171674 RepID=UPI003F184F19
MTISAEHQWRADFAKHLKGARLQYRRYERWSETWDHDHCAGCWAKFMEAGGPDIQDEGYTTCDDYEEGAGYEWVCRECFDILKEHMQWTVVPAHGSIRKPAGDTLKTD